LGITRLGKLLVALGLSFALIAVIRGGNTSSYTRGMTLGAGETVEFSDFWPPTSLWLRVNSPVGLDMTITDPSNSTILSVTDASSSTDCRIQLTKRGTYHVNIHNPTETRLSVLLVDYTLYNLESDIVQTSIILIVVGAAIIATPRLLTTFKRKPA